MTTLVEHTHKAALDAPISLFRLDATKIGGAINYFCKGTLGGAPISFGGQEYVPIDIEMSDFEVNAGGALPTPTLRISNSDDRIQNLVNTYGDLAGCEIRRVRTFKRFLDGESEEDSSAFIGPDVFRVDRLSEDNGDFFEWELSAAIDQEGKMLPGGQVLRDTCPLRYRTYNPDDPNAAPDGFVYPTVNPCPYTGSNAFTITGEATISASDRCGRQLSSCKLRFPNQPVPFGGFPGAARVRL